MIAKDSSCQPDAERCTQYHLRLPQPAGSSSSVMPDKLRQNTLPDLDCQYTVFIAIDTAFHNTGPERHNLPADLLFAWAQLHYTCKTAAQPLLEDQPGQFAGPRLTASMATEAKVELRSMVRFCRRSLDGRILHAHAEVQEPTSMDCC